MVGPRRTLAKRTSSRTSSSQASKRTMFGSARSQKYADIVSFKSPEQAKHSVNQLLLDFDMAKTRAKKVRVKRVAVLAMNRAYATVKRSELSAKERDEFAQIGNIYKNAARRMQLED